VTVLGDDLPSGLEAGYHRFRATRFATERARWRQLGEEGQRPATMVIACSDSRSGPETVFDAGPGELFVVRNVAGLVPVYAPDAGSHGASAALEFAVLALGVRSIVILGHGRCGGISAAIRGQPTLTSTDFLGTWVAGLRDLAAEVRASGTGDPAALQRALEQRSIERSVEHLRTFPWIASREDAGSLRLHGAWFDIGLGELHVLSAVGWARQSDA
jgi:carbonic anhydrase